MFKLCGLGLNMIFVSWYFLLEGLLGVLGVKCNWSMRFYYVSFCVNFGLINLSIVCMSLCLLIVSFYLGKGLVRFLY